MVNRKTAYLTIDDGPTPATPLLMDRLEARKIPAVFFFIGDRIKKYREIAIEAIQRGYTIGNHSMSHPYFSKIEIAEINNEILQTDDLIEELYTAAGKERPQRYFRFPYGDKGDGRRGRIFRKIQRDHQKNKSDIIQSILVGAGYVLPNFEDISYEYWMNNLSFDADWHWTFDVMDWVLKSENSSVMGMKNLRDLISRMESQRPDDPRGYSGEQKCWLATDSSEIILMHDFEETSDYIPLILDHLQKTGIDFIDLP